MSRIAERSAVRVRPPYKQVTETFSGNTSYALGGNVYNSTILRQIERAAVIQTMPGHLRGQVITGSISGNAFKIQVFTGGVTGEPAAATNLATAVFTVLLEGL